MRQLTVNVYQFDELSDTAKERAREWYRGCIDASDYDGVIEDAVRMGEMFGVEFDTDTVRLMDNSTRQDPRIYWSGFSSQGDGACFVGSYGYKPGALKAVKKEAPEDTDLHGIVERLQKVQAANFYQLRATVTHTGHYNHAYSTSIEVEREDMKEATNGAGDEVAECLRDFMNWIYSNLERENEYLYSDEQVDDAIRANEYEFDEDGARI